MLRYSGLKYEHVKYSYINAGKYPMVHQETSIEKYNNKKII